MKPEHRSRILELAANRGENRRKSAIESALALKGSISEAEAATLSDRTQRIRSNWR
jgi:hypothetical protein